MQIITRYPVTLFTSPSYVAARAAAEQAVQQALCPHQTHDCGCTSCQGVQRRQHYALLWLIPEDQYKREDLQEIFAMAQRSRGIDEHYFFVLEYAERMTPGGANHLLKLLEEPPPGFHFILIPEDPTALLPTVASRAVMVSINAAIGAAPQPALVQLFMQDKPVDAATFDRAVANAASSHHAVRTIFYLLRDHCMDQYRAELAAEYDNPSTRERIDLCHRLAKKLPIAGGAELFWRMLYLMWPWQR